MRKLKYLKSEILSFSSDLAEKTANSIGVEFALRNNFGAAIEAFLCGLKVTPTSRSLMTNLARASLKHDRDSGLHIIFGLFSPKFRF
jgi:hypothetical protein